MADPECARGGGVSHILAEKRGVSFTSFQIMHENAIFFHQEGGGRTPGTPYAGSATDQSTRYLNFGTLSSTNCVVLVGTHTFLKYLYLI